MKQNCQKNFLITNLKKKREKIVGKMFRENGEINKYVLKIKQKQEIATFKGKVGGLKLK